MQIVKQLYEMGMNKADIVKALHDIGEDPIYAVKKLQDMGKNTVLTAKPLYDEGLDPYHVLKKVQIMRIKEKEEKERFNRKCDAYREMLRDAKDHKDLKNRLNAFRSGMIVDKNGYYVEGNTAAGL